METAGKGVLGAMEREVSLEDISDGKLYGINDMVRADSGGCEGCSACCRGMGHPSYWTLWICSAFRGTLG